MKARKIRRIKQFNSLPSSKKVSGRFLCRMAGLMIMSVLSLFTGYASSGESAKQPDNKLFIIERSRDSDYLVYLLNRDETGLPVKDTPIEVFWVTDSISGRLGPISSIQRRLGYGVEILTGEGDPGTLWRFRLAAFRERTFILRKESDDNYMVYLDTTDIDVNLEKIFVQFSNKSFWNPQVAFVTITGKYTTEGTRYNETVRRDQIFNK